MALSEEPKNLRPGIHDALSRLGLPLLKGLLGPSCGGPVSLLGPWQAVCQTLPPACPSSRPLHPRPIATELPASDPSCLQLSPRGVRMQD